MNYRKFVSFISHLRKNNLDDGYIVLNHKLGNKRCDIAYYDCALDYFNYEIETDGSGNYDDVNLDDFYAIAGVYDNKKNTRTDCYNLNDIDELEYLLMNVKSEDVLKALETNQSISCWML